MQKSGLVAQMQSNITGLEAQLKQTQSKLTALEKEKNMERARSKNASMHSQVGSLSKLHMHHLLDLRSFTELSVQFIRRCSPSKRIYLNDWMNWHQRMRS